LVAFFLVPFFFAAFFFAAMQDHLLDGQTLPTIGAIVENVVGSRQKLGSGRPYASSRVHRVASIVNGVHLPCHALDLRVSRARISLSNRTLRKNFDAMRVSTSCG
jgi:hypothetical protein